MEKLQRFYLDTSVFGGVFDAGFEDESSELFERVRRGEILCLYSDLTVAELLAASARVQEVLQHLPPHSAEMLTSTEESEFLARKYIEEGVVGLTSLDDCRHIALASIRGADLLVSWNFRHIVNVYRIRGYNAVNLRLGYKQLEIRSPREIVHHEDQDSNSTGEGI